MMNTIKDADLFLVAGVSGNAPGPNQVHPAKTYKGSISKGIGPFLFGDA